MTYDLATARNNAGHSAKSLARELDISEHSVRALERGDRVHPATAKKIADYFSTDEHPVRVTDLMPLEAAAS